MAQTADYGDWVRMRKTKQSKTIHESRLVAAARRLSTDTVTVAVGRSGMLKMWASFVGGIWGFIRKHPWWFLLIALAIVCCR